MEAQWVCDNVSQKNLGAKKLMGTASVGMETIDSITSQGIFRDL